MHIYRTPANGCQWHSLRHGIYRDIFDDDNNNMPWRHDNIQHICNRLFLYGGDSPSINQLRQHPRSFVHRDSNKNDNLFTPFLRAKRIGLGHIRLQLRWPGWIHPMGRQR